MVVEWFPPEMNEISVTVQATTISISNYTTKTFEKYTKTVINFHRWGSSPPQFLYLDLHGTVSNPSFLTIGHLIVYGVKETISNVNPSVYDTAFVIENGKMVINRFIFKRTPTTLFHSPHKRFFKFDKRGQKFCFKWCRNNFIAG